MLLVDDDQPEAGHRSEDRRPRPDDDSRLARHDPSALVAALRVGQCRVENRDAVAEPGANAADGLGSQRDLGHEHDRTEPSLEHCSTRLEVDLGLPRPRRAPEQERSAARVDRADDPRDGGGQLVGEGESGSAFPEADCRARPEMPGSSCASACSGATSASARPGVEP